MPRISELKRKWWHTVLSIRSRTDNSVLKSFSTINPSNYNSNISPYIISAYASSLVDCSSPISIPVPAFESDLSPGYFLFRPSTSDLGDSIVNILTYQDAINLNKRHIFEFTRYAAYDSLDTNCSSFVPNSIDTLEYEKVTNGLNSNIFKYSELQFYNQIGCCEVELSIPGVDLPELDTTSRATSVWFLCYNASTLTHSLYSYNFARISDALVFRGNIVLPNSVSRIFDITWIPLNNTIIALCDTGIYRLLPGDSTHDAFIVQEPILLENPIPGSTIFPITASDTFSLKLKIEYNYYDTFLYVFVPVKITIDGSIRWSFFKCNYQNNSFPVNSYSQYNQIVPSELGLNGLAFYSGELPYTIWGDNLCYIDSGNISSIVDSSSRLLAGMNTLAFAENPDVQITDNVLYATNTAGQIFSVDKALGTTVNLGITLPVSPIGSATTINGEDVRIQPFPFIIGESHWLFMVDISSTMAGNRLPAIKTAFINMLQTYVRYGDKITVLWFGSSYGKITKELKTYSDANEVINYINTFFVTTSGNTNFCNAFSSISQDFTDIKNLIILSDGTFDDCSSSSSSWQLNIQTSVNSIISSNSGIKFTCIGVRTSSGTEKLQYIAEVSAGTYANWT